MAVNASCASFNEQLQNDHLTLDDGSLVEISIYTICEGKTKSPQCCEEDIFCEV